MNSIINPPVPANEVVTPSIKFELGALKFWALGDRVLVEEDEFKSGYECTLCNGAGKIACDNCKGEGSLGIKKCGFCEGSGKIVCPSCSGKGGLIITPDVSQRRPATGRVVSAGHQCKMVKVGDAVLYSNFAGYTVDLQRAGHPICIRILHESEILSGMEGHLTLTNFKGKSDIAQFNP